MDPMMQQMMAQGAQQPAQPQPGLIERFLLWLRANPQQGQAAGRDVADSLNAILPEAVSARSAVLQKRQRMKDLDAQTRE